MLHDTTNILSMLLICETSPRASSSPIFALSILISFN